MKVDAEINVLVMFVEQYAQEHVEQVVIMIVEKIALNIVEIPVI